MLLQHKLLLPLELTQPLERPHRVRDPAGGIRGEDLFQLVVELVAHGSPQPLDPDETAYVRIARTRKPKPFRGSADLPPGLRGRRAVAVQRTDEDGDPGIVRREREAHLSSVPGRRATNVPNRSRTGALCFSNTSFGCGREFVPTRQTSTRASSSTDVRPAATFARPSSQSERIPASIAARSISSRLACLTASCAIDSVIVSS